MSFKKENHTYYCYFFVAFREEKSQELDGTVNFHNPLRPLNKSNQVEHATICLNLKLFVLYTSDNFQFPLRPALLGGFLLN